MTKLNENEIKLKRRLLEAGGGKIGRDAFLYMSPQPPEDRFAQCGTCRLFVPDRDRCAILGPNVEVLVGYSCGSYVHGKPHEQPIQENHTPEEVGLVRHEVRCENCISFEAGSCRLYAALEEKMGDVFDLGGDRVEEYACCNAMMPSRQISKG